MPPSKLDHQSFNRVSEEYSLSKVISTWSPRFEPYLDPSQWQPYNGETCLADGSLKKLGRGRRKSKRFRNDMDHMQSGRKGNRLDDFLYDGTQNHCSKCKKAGHKKQTCPQNERGSSRGRGRGRTSNVRGGRARQVLHFNNVSTMFTIFCFLSGYLNNGYMNFYFNNFAGWLKEEILNVAMKRITVHLRLPMVRYEQYVQYYRFRVIALVIYIFLH